MFLLKRVAMIIAVVVSAIKIEAADGVVYLIKPVFDTTTLGVATDSDEREELYGMLTEHCSKIFKSAVIVIDRKSIDEIMKNKADFLIWNLEHYHYLYDDQEHVPCIKASLYRFSAENNYITPILAVTPPIVTGESAYGNMAPFREGIDANFKVLKKMFKNGCYRKLEIPQYSAETILSDNPIRDVSTKIFVTVSPINDSSVGTSPADYELFHLPRMVAHFVGELFGKIQLS
jgi:hypothetical protein